MKSLFRLPNLFLYYTLVLVVLSLSTNAQPGCPEVSAGNNVQLPCGTNCTTLTATPFQVGSTGTYGVSSIPYTPFSYSTGTAVLVHTDDLWSGVVTIPFQFCFFGNVYNQAIIGSNGNLSFNTANANNYNPWPISTPVPSANDVFSEINNSVMCPWEDIDPTHRGNIYYQTIGTAPCRIFIVSWQKCGYYGDANSTCASCDTDVALFATSQVVLYETTNVIEIYIQQKQDLHAWNSGLAIEGIENNAATVAYTVPGRNATVWTANNDAWRFTPNGPSIVSVSWYNGATQISTDSFANVCPLATTTYTAKAVYTPCSGGVPVTVTDDVTISLSGTLNAGVDSTVNVSCGGIANGSAYAHVTGGVAPVTYGWSTGSTALAIHNLAPGTYSFSVADGSGCMRIDTFTINNSIPIGISATLTNPACHGSCNGNIATIDSGGTGGPYTYLWSSSPVQTTQTATNLCAGSYTITVNDGNGCTAQASFSLTDPAPVVVNQVSLTNVTCRGENNGLIVVAAGGGYNGPVSFQWSNGETSAQDTALALGNYQVTATDSLGCSATAAYVITQPANGISLNAPTVTNILCYGNANGVIVANATGGSGQLTYAWTQASSGTPYSGQAINNLSADTYQLTVTDANGCYDTASYSLASPPQIFIDSVIYNDVICSATNGHAQVFAHGGTGALTYKWSANPAISSSSISGLSGGSYAVTVTDASGCSVSSGFTIFQATPIVISVANQTNVLCNGGANGSVTVSASGGTPGYNFAWSNGTGGATDSNLAVGNYTVSVSDNNGCNASKTYIITQPNALLPGIANIQNIGCSGGITGSITANPNGGTQPYNYTWVEQSNNAGYSTKTINNLAADIYYLTVTDANGCSIDTLYSITAVPLLSYTIDSTNVLCAGGNNGSIKVSILSGSPPYQYTFNNTNYTDSLYKNLMAGLVDVRIRDASGCTAEDFVNIQEPPPLVIHQDVLTNILCNGGNNGKLAVHYTGGTPGYSTLWSNYVTSTDDSGLVAGNYSVTVTDTNACTATQSYQITQPPALTAAPIGHNALCFAANDGSIDANPAGGTAPYTFVWNDGSTTQVDGNLALGTYSCTIEDAHGCNIIISDTVGQPTLVLVTDSVSAVKCVGQHNGQAFIYPTGGVPPYDYSATKDGANFIYSTNGVIQGLDTGSYNINISDSVGCVKQIVIYIPPAIPDSFSTRADSTLCYGPNYCDGAALVAPLTLQNGPYTFLLNEMVLQDTGYFQKLCAGLNIIIVTSANGCIDTIPVVIPQPLPILIEINPDSVTIPLGGSQQVVVTCQNVTNPSYNWIPFVGLSCADCPAPVVNPYTSGDYMLVVSMENGAATCYDTAVLHVFVLPHSRAYVPNAFTPNGDGNNDRFEIYGEDIKVISLKIFNRWGEEVFETTNSLDGWDGTYKGVGQNIGVYTYEAIITYLDDTQEIKKGTVTLLR